MQFKINKEYHYNTISNALRPSEWTETEYGPMNIGEMFLSFKNIESGNIISFIMTGYNNGGGSYFKCIYNDI